ncbi:Thioredoxin family protein [Histomonas meleagridis]|uniref:Thioredoxin family protein n=1 Tax=Histomonas meleagridis TaxID=135588 RepID=UPI0035599E6E|nr:Thioredoxin family protein [Histomonas meleagridis]
MLFFFALTAFLNASESKVVMLTDKTFEAEVLKHKPNEVWFVMFMTDDDNETVLMMNRFKNASEHTEGMVKFGVLNIRRAPKPVEMYELQNVTSSWVDSFVSQPSAIYFTNKTKKRPLWSGISTYFYKKPVRIGICRNESLFSSFKVTQIPSVVFFNGTHREVYNGPIRFKSLCEGIERFFEKRFREPIDMTDENEILLPDQFIDYCVGGKQMCLLSVSSQVPSGASTLLKEKGRRKLLLFAGTQNLPFKFMEEGGIWIYHPRKDAFVHIEKAEDLLSTMDRVFDGSAKWIKRAKLDTNNEL